MNSTTPLPLDGIRVVEFSHMVMGPTCGLVLADMGAEVIKIEPPGVGDRTRVLTNSGTGFFAAFSRNKKSVQVDLEDTAEREVLLRLINTADVVIENFRPGGLDAKGLSYSDLSARNPRLIYCSLKGFLSGPYEKRTALDEVVQMMTGLAYMTGPVGRPLRAGAPVNDMMGGMFGAIAVLGALRQREMTGTGQHVQSGLFENSAFLVSTHMLQQAISGKEPPPMPSGKRAWGVYDVFESADNVQIFVGVVTDRQWQIFADRLQEPELLDAAWATNTLRAQGRERLIPLVAQMLKKHSVANLEEMCEAAGLPFARITKPWDLFDDPHLNHAGGMVSLTLPDGLQTSSPALPIQFGSSRFGLRSPVPAAGQHTTEVLEAFRKRMPDAAE